MRESPPSVDAPGGEARAARGEALLALRNALKLGTSLVFTWGIGLAVQLLMPRMLGPEAFGPVAYAMALTTLGFVVVGLGLDMYIRKEIPVRPEHAGDFFASTLIARLLLSAVVFASILAFITWDGQPPEVHGLVIAFGVVQLLTTTNLSLAALLQSHGTVDGLSVLNVVAKVIWFAGVLVGLFLVSPLLVATSFVLSEAVKLVVSWLLVRRHLRLRWRVDFSSARAVIVASLPFYLNTVAHTAYNKLDVPLLNSIAGPLEQSYYSAATTIAGMTLMLAPMIGWVMMPLLARARARSRDEFQSVLRRSLELVLVVSVPISLAIGLGADLWMSILSAAYAPGTISLKIFAPLFLVTYVAMISGLVLVLEERAWAVTLISLGGLALNIVLNLLLIEPALRMLGPGGGGAGCSLAQLLTELVVTIAMTVLIGRSAFDRRSLVIIGKTVAVSLFVVWIDSQLAGFSPLSRIIIDAIVYCVLVIATGAVRLREMASFARSAFKRPREVVA